MKTTLYISTFFFLAITAGCKTVNDLMEVGEYDEAITMATQKLAETADKKTKHITALEEGFEKMNRYNLFHINHLKERIGQGEDHLWEEIYEYVALIEMRQARVAPLLPLVSKSGYEGQFEFMDVRILKEEASNNVAADLYQIGSDSLKYAIENQDKKAAQNAYHNLRRIGLYIANYKDARALITESKNAGTYNLLLKINEKAVPDEFDLVINAERALGRLSPWVEYHKDVKEGISYDAITTISIDDVYVSSDKEKVENFLTFNPTPKTDSLSAGTTQTRGEDKVFEETSRTKECRISASLEIEDFISGTTLVQKSFVQIKSFKSEGSTLYSTNQGLSSSRGNGNLEPFPFNREMTIDVINEISERIFKYMSRIDSEDLYQAGIAFN